MSYLDRTQDSRRRSVGLAGTIVVQGLIGYVVLTGLAVHFVPRTAQPPTTGTNFPLPPPPPPTPTPTPQPKATATPKDPVAPPVPIPLPTPRPTVAHLDPGPIPVPHPTYSPPIRSTPPVAFKAKAAAPRNDPATWVNEGDYPPRDENLGNEGTTVFRVTVGADGRVSACTIVRSSGHAGLDAAACKAVKARARFAPATDENGNRVPGSYSNSVRWQIPR